MKVCFLDCFSGISGDMLLGAFVHAGWDVEELEGLPRLLGLGGVSVSARRVTKNGISAVKVDVHEADTGASCRTLGHIVRIIEDSSLQDDIKKQVIRAFKRLAEAEARVHGIRPEQVHFHETGAVDAMIDVTGAFVAKNSLGIRHVVCSPLPLSTGTTICQHGPIPLPAPAVLELLRDKEVYFVEAEKELVTPTRALVALELSDAWSELPKMKVTETGYGAGTWDLPDRPNLLRVIIGERCGVEGLSDQVAELSAVVDDMNPELVGHFVDRALESGALDAWVCPVYMKKNRPGFEIHLLARPEDAGELARFFLTATTSIGVRIRRTNRIILPRRKVQVETRLGPVTAKAVKRPDGSIQIVPEFEECRRMSERLGIPISRVYEEVVRGRCEGEGREGR